VALARDLQAVGHVQAQRAQHGVGHLGLVGSEEQQVAGLDVHGFLQLGVNVVLEELDDGALAGQLRVGVGVGDPGHALRAVLGGEVAQLLHVAAAPVAGALAVDGLHDAARLDGLGEHAEAAAAHDLGQVDELHAEADVRAVAAETLHGLGVLHALQREGMLDANGLEGFLHDVFHHVDDVVALDERHLDVDLCEFRLAIGAQVLVAEAAGDLVVALDAAHHEHLLELLRALRQRVELAGVRAARHDVVARALGRGVCQDRRLDFQELALVERGAHGGDHLVAQPQVGEHLGTADVQVAPLHARGLVGLDAVLDAERRGDRLVQHLDGAGEHLDFARHHVGVDRLGAALAHFAGELQHVLAAEVLGQRELLGAHAVGVDDHLRVAVAIAQVNEDEPAVVAVVPRPTGQCHLAPAIVLAQLAACCGVHAIFILEIRHCFRAPHRVLSKLQYCNAGEKRQSLGAHVTRAFHRERRV